MKKAKLSPMSLRLRFHKFAWTLMISAVLSGCQCAKAPPVEEPTEKILELGEGKDSFALMFSTSVHGYVEPCGCTSQPLGGIARLATVVETVRGHYSLGSLFIDGGDLLFDSAKPRNPADLCQERARVDLLLGALKDLKLLGTFKGSFDDAMGNDYREERLKYFGISDLSTRARQGILERSNGFKMGILLLDEISVRDLNEKAKNLSLQEADAVVVISRLPRAQTRTIAEKLTHVDVIVMASVSDETPAPIESVGPNGPFMVSAATQGQYLGIVSFHKSKAGQSGKWQLDDRKQQKEARIALLTQRKKNLLRQIEQNKDENRLNFLRARVSEIEIELKNLVEVEDAGISSGNIIQANAIALTRSIQPQPDFEARLKNYEKKIPELVAQCEANVDCPVAGVNQPKFVGAESCKNCHAAAYEVWKKAVYELPGTDENGNAITIQSGHSKAWSTLVQKQKIEDRTCIGCHSIGFMQPGGYCKVKEVDFRANVQCESCHGAGSLHVVSGEKRFIRRDVPESVCRSCHHVPHIPTTESFVYNEKVQKILGKGHGELLLERLKHESMPSTKN